MAGADGEFGVKFVAATAQLALLLTSSSGQAEDWWEWPTDGFFVCEETHLAATGISASCHDGESNVSLALACEGLVRFFLVTNDTTIADIQRNLDAGNILDMQLPPNKVNEVLEVDLKDFISSQALIITIDIPNFPTQSTISYHAGLAQWAATRQRECGL